METYKVEIKDNEGVHEYELDKLENIDLLLMKHPGYESVEAKQNEKTKANN